MDHARDRAGRLIRTHQAVSHRFYTCPVCSADVFLRRGRKYQHHFAHRSGYGKPECELFHPTDEVGTTWTQPVGPSDGSSSNRAIPPLSLSIELEPEALIRGKRLRRWGLRLTVPKSDHEHGRVTIDFGTGHPVTFALSNLSLGSQTHVAALDAQEFGASWISPEVRPSYRQAIEERILGLDRTLVNVFVPSTQKYKPRSDILTWGSSYYFVWRADCLTELHSGLSALPLAPEDNWRCALVTLPADEDTDLKTWLHENAGLNFNQQRRLIGIVIPAPCGIDVYGRPVVPDTRQFLIGLSLGQSTSDNDRKFSCSSGRETAAVSLSNSGRHLIEVGVSFEKSVVDFHLDGNPLLTLAPYTHESDEHFQSIVLEVRSVDARTSRRASLHQAQGNAALRDLRDGRVSLVGLNYPRGVTAHLRWRFPPTIQWQELVLSKTGPGGAAIEATTDELLKINSILQDRSLDVQFDFGPFGSFYDSGAARQDVTQPFTLSPQIRRRMIWVCKSTGHFIDRTRTPIDKLSDAVLTSMFEALPATIELKAHKAALAREIERAKFRMLSHER